MRIYLIIYKINCKYCNYSIYIHLKIDFGDSINNVNNISNIWSNIKLHIIIFSKYNINIRSNIHFLKIIFS